MGELVRVRGIEMAYDDGGGGGTPVVLLHGFPFDRSMWREQIESLKDSYRVIAPDLRGHGQTSVTGGAATMEEMADDVAALLDELGVGRVVVGGLSMGGYVTLAFCRKHAERVAAVVLADTRPQPDTEEGRRGREKMVELALREGMAPIADAMLPKVLAPQTLGSKPELVARVREMILGTNPEGAAAALRGMAARRDQTDLLPRLGVPALVIVGTEDSVTPPADAEAMHRLIPGSRLVKIEGAGHASNLERAADFNRALREFLDGLGD
ncbi:MAG TPA: alpha/beta fold hydrolase [Pyrinomonadaceae bacterium]|nr:alpha/beta fold hydrolase [Pyrinomonadaceae bacterium]